MAAVFGWQDPGNYNRICPTNQPYADCLPGSPAAGLCLISDVEIGGSRLYLDITRLVVFVGRAETQSTLLLMLSALIGAPYKDLRS